MDENPLFFSELEEDLKEVIKLVPSHVVEIFKTIHIYANMHYYYNEKKAAGACTHWSAGWLVPNGNLAIKEGHIEIYDVENYINWRKD